MPHVVNGIGTWYYGKRNVDEYEGMCEACNAVTTLTSYDTRLYFVFLFIPLIPLGRKRIIERCRACSRHRVMSLGTWNESRRRFEELLEACRRSGGDAELAREALAACLSMRDLRGFLTLAEQLRQSHTADSEMLRIVGLGYRLFGRVAEAEEALRQALAVEDVHETRELLAECLLVQQRPGEAEPFLEHIAGQGIAERIDLLLYLAQAWQAEGEHERALAVFAQCERLAPQIAEDKTFQRLRDASEERLGTHVQIKPGSIVHKAKSAEGRRRFAKIATVILVLAVLVYSTVCWIQGMRRPVYIANGLDREYTIQLNDTEYALPPNAITKVVVGEGDLEVQIVGAPWPAPAETVSIRTSFFSRPFNARVFVLNPDQTAIIQRVKMWYSASPHVREPHNTWYAGRLLHDFADVDHPFEEFPESITLSSHSDEASRVGLTLVASLPPLSASMVLWALRDELDPDTLVHVAQQRLLLEPENSDFLWLLDLWMEPEDCAAFLRAHLERRPLLVDWHRYYQDLMEKADQAADVERAYEQMLAEEPGNTDLIYLAARSSLDEERALELCQKAVASDPPSGHAHLWLSGYHLARAEFPAAARHAGRAMELLPTDQSTRRFCRVALLADGRFEPLLAIAQEEQAKPFPDSYWAYADEAYVRTLLAQGEEASDVLDKLRGRLKEWSPETVSGYVSGIEADLAYAAGDVGRYVELLADSADPRDRLQAHLANGNLTAADEEFAALPMPAAGFHVLLYVAATQEDEPELAERHRAAAVELLAQGTLPDRLTARALASEPQASIEEVLALRELPADKAVRLIAIGLLHAEYREACFALAGKLNFDRRFPHLLLKQVLDTSAGQ